MSVNNIFKSKVATNAIWIISGRIIRSLLGLVISMMTARYLGPSNFGLISYAASIVAFSVPLMNLGLSNILVQEYNKYPEDEGKITGTSIIFSFISALACIVGIISYTLQVDRSETNTNIVVILYSLVLIFQALELTQYWFQAKLLSKYMSIVSLTVYLVVASYRIFLLISNANIYWFALSSSIEYLLMAIALLFLYKKLGGKRICFSLDIGKRMFSKSKYYIMSNLMVMIFAQTDKIMIKLMINETAVGYYSAAVTCAVMTAFVYAAIIDSFRPSIYKSKADGDEKEYEKQISLLYCIIIYLSLIQSGIMTIFAPLIINILFGSDYSSAILALQIIVWYSTFSYMGAVRDIWILGENKQKYLWLLNLGGAGLNIGLNLVFIPLWGIYGSAFASLLTQIFTNIFMNRIVGPLKYNNHLILKGLNPMLVLSIFKESK